MTYFRSDASMLGCRAARTVQKPGKKKEKGIGKEMVFKGRFFYSKKSDSSSPDGSNSPKTQNSGSPIRSEKKKVKSAKEEQQIGGSFDAACREMLEMGKSNSSWINSGGLRSSNICTPETPYDCGTPKDSESPGDIKSFSHELNSKGVRPFPFWKPRGLNNLEEVLVAIRAKFYKAKEEVDSDLAIFAGDLVGILENNTETHPEWQETIEDLLVLARRCAIMTPREFWLKCEGIVQDLDDQRQEIPMGMLKQLHTRMLFILTRCTRLLHFRNESGFPEDEHVLGLHQYRVLHSSTT